ncbi:unnamed protein product [Didymodactylos carnosus]|uniref:Uncharacterized protein n=1 Tax=Didymodactylos carnosus TaxID=1234261 RepID=A0A8S2EG67_9BILA|nr:unnamed protein product [Didymodactylos carnosus]CAF4024321.1 unnamed protein product [Didymodactylos carnosus]
MDISFKSTQNDHPNLARTYSSIAQCYNMLDNFNAALFYHKKALRIRLKSLPICYSDIITSYINIGSLYTYQAKYKLALKYLKKAIVQSSPSTNKELVAYIYYTLGTLYEFKSNSDIAIKYYKRAISLECECNQSNTIPNLATIYISLGEFYLENDDTTNALIQFEKALEIGENCLEIDDSTIRLVLPYIVKVFQIKKDYATALEHITKLLNIAQKDLCTTSDDLATIYFNIGYINYCKYNNKKAIRNYRKALKYASPTSPKIGELYYGLALIYDDRKDLNVALRNYKNALQFFSNSDDFSASIYNNIGAIYYLKHDYKRALWNYYKALTVIEIDSELASILYYNMALIDDIKKDYINALYSYEAVLETIKNHRVENEDLLIKTYNNMGGIYKQISNYEEELNCYRKVVNLELNSNKVSKNYELIATTYSNLSIIYFRQYNFSSALQGFEEALRIASKSLTSDHPHIPEYRNYIALTKKYLQSKGIENV